MKNEQYDVIILGSGPAGLQAAIHAARRKASVLILGRIGRSSAYSAHIENYCCVDGGTGAELLKQARKKAEESGAEFVEEDATELELRDGVFQVSSEGGNQVEASAVILAMGIARNKLNVKGEKEFFGKGISNCVDCDAGFYRGESVAMVGSGSAAVTGALTMLFYAKEVHLICDRLEVADYLIEKLKESPIAIHEGRRVAEIVGDQTVNGVVLDDGSTLKVGGVFIELGAKGATALAGGLGVALDSETMRYIATNKNQETNVPGVYAAGDICGPPWQVAKSVGEGCVAGLEAAAYAKKRKSAP
ncbi:MAG: NAD(P)/FAD-dependent oxidoreductase [Desulfobacteraceae bacterium]|nr:MAG: NAD(P)/FAD-dependent oxidoreductase [Desulfobacteraceae bacterium]